MKSKVVILGARGSMPVSGKKFIKYGGSTTCIFLRLDGQPIVVDAGTGILRLPEVLKPEEQQLPLLLSHPHADHLLGLPMCPVVFDSKKGLDIYASRKNSMDTKQQVCALMKPPLWPVGPEQLPGKISFHTLPSKFCLGNVEVESMEGIHPGGVTLFRLTGGGKKVVILTDCTLTEDFLPEVTEFARGCDLLLCDGQYAPSEWAGREKFGHSTWTAAARLGAACGAMQVRIIHHDPSRTDIQLDDASEELKAIHKNCTFAQDGEEIIL